MAAWTDAEREQQALLRRFLAATDAAAIATSAVQTARETDLTGPGSPAASLCRDAGSADTEYEGAEAVLARLEVCRGDREQGAARALRLAQRSFGFTLNYELILICCRIALASAVASARLPTLQFAGLAQAYLGHHDRAAEIFEAAHAQARLPEARAQLSYYRGLIASNEAIRHLECGLGIVGGGTARGALADTVGRLRSGGGPAPGELGPDDPLCRLRLDRPKPKLTTPFPIAHLVTDAAFASNTHDLALGTVRTPPPGTR